MSEKEEILKDDDLIHGSGNVYRDFGYPDADVRLAKAIIAARIIGVLDDEDLSTRDAQARTGVNQSDFTRIRRSNLKRFSLDRLITILNKLGQEVTIDITMTPRPYMAQVHHHRLRRDDGGR